MDVELRMTDSEESADEIRDGSDSDGGW